MHSHYGKDGSFHGTSTDNIFGGHDYVHADGSLGGSTHHNIFGGHDYFDDMGNYEGGSIPTGMHHTPSFHDVDGHIGSHPHMLDGNSNSFHSNIHDHFSGIRVGLLDQIK
jgi:hypothetical protein